MEPNPNATRQVVVTLNGESLPELEKTRSRIKFGFDDSVTIRVYSLLVEEESEKVPNSIRRRS